jgi:hypothetical protein
VHVQRVSDGVVFAAQALHYVRYATLVVDDILNWSKLTLQSN